MHFWDNQFMCDPPNGFITWMHNGIELARLVASMNDPVLFNDIYDSYYMMVVNGFFAVKSIFLSDDFQEIILDNDYIFQNALERKPYEYSYTKKLREKYGKEGFGFCSINPVINLCLKYSLEHLNKYKKRAVEILKYGIQHNKRVKEGLVNFEHTFIDDCGALRKLNNNEIIDVIVFCDSKETGDKEIDNLINSLPTFYNFYK